LGKFASRCAEQVVTIFARPTVPVVQAGAGNANYLNCRTFNCKLSISALCLTDTNYILSKQNPEMEVRKILRKFKVLVNVLSLDDKITDLALNSEFRDFEDDIQYYTAIENNQDLIITRNQQDFRNSKIPIITAGEFIKSFE
jgi:hypothetical protein